MLNRKRKGFTLIELIVVMAIIAILVLLAAPKYLNYTKDAHVTAMQQDAKVLSNIALGYNVKNDGIYPVYGVGDDGIAGTADDEITPNAIAWTSEVTLDKVNAAILETGETPLTDADFATFEPALVSGSLQGLKNDLGDYAIIINGAHEGEVVYLEKVLENSDGVKFVSVSPAIDQTLGE